MREVPPKYSNVFKILKLIFLITFFISCGSKDKVKAIDYAGFLEQRILLSGFNKQIDQKDTLGYLIIKIPSRLDTFYQWHNTSDCLPCGRIQYRFADRHYQQFAESGFYRTFQPDSVYQFTITHNPIKEVPDSLSIKPFVIIDTNRISDHLINEATFCTETSFLKKEFKEINGRAFAISTFTSPCSLSTGNISLFFTAQTTLRNRYLNFIAECSVSDSAGFINNMYKSLLSVSIEEKQ